MDAPRDNLVREMPFEVTRTEEDGDGLTFEGYAAVWDSPTEINSRSEGNFIEQMKRGSFKRTLNAKMPVFMFDHGQHPLFGSMPLGTIQEAREDDRGLFIRARFSDNWLIQPIRDACADGSIPGMSFRMSIPEGGETWRRARAGQLAERDITEVKCPELGPVVFPAYEDTTVGVRSREVLDALSDGDVLADLARALFASERMANENDEERMMNPEAAQLALRDAIRLHQAIMAGTEPTNEASQQRLMNHLLNARAVLSGGTMEMKSEELDPDVTVSRDVEITSEPADGTSEDATPDPADEATPRGATETNTQERRFDRMVEAKRLGVFQ